MKSWLTASLSSLLLFLLPATSHGQIETSSLVGTVTDEQGKLIPQAQVRATEVATGLDRETETASQGSYKLLDLPAGRFSVQISKNGFATTYVENVEQIGGLTHTLDAKLMVAGGSQQTTVTASLVQLDRVDATIGAPVEQEQINELPINGRNWATLTSLAPGAIDNGAGDQRTIRFAGHGLDDNNLTLDGVDATAVYNQEQREYMRLNIPLDSIDQFQVKTQTYGADVEGGTSGGQVNVNSPSGTNALHGDLFDYFRNDSMEARTPFNGSSPNPFLLNQFGAGLGGPIVKNKTFFYINYEGLRQRLDGTQIGLVPSPSFIKETTSTSPALSSILSAFPLGTSPTSNPNVWNYQANGRQIDNEDSGMIRIDQHFSERTTGFLRFNADEAVEKTPTGQLIALTAYDTKYKNGVIDLLHIFTPTLVNDLKFGVNQTIYQSSTISPLQLGFAVSGLSSLAGQTASLYPSKDTDLIDDVAWARGKHTIKFGFEFKYIFLNQGTAQSGTLTYTSLNNFMDNAVGSASYTANLPLVRQRKGEYWGFVQDEWKVTTSLTVTAGIRYNFYNALHAINNQDVPFDFGTCGGYCPKTDTFFHPRSDDFDPRVGVAWSHGNTVLRVGGGIYHSDAQIDDQNLPISNTVDRYSFNNTAFPGLAYPLTPFLNYAEAGGLGVVSPRDLDRNRKDEYVAAWTASIQQKLPWDFLGTASYLGNKSTDVLTTTYVNLVDPATGAQPYPAFGPVSWRGDVGNATFEALQLSARRAFQSGILLSTNYMWSHSINDGSIGGGESDTPQDSFAAPVTKLAAMTTCGRCSIYPPFILFRLGLGSFT